MFCGHNGWVARNHLLYGMTEYEVNCYWDGIIVAKHVRVNGFTLEKEIMTIAEKRDRLRRAGFKQIETRDIIMSRVN